MKYGLIASLAIGLAVIAAAGSPARAGNGQGGGYNNCQPGRPGCHRPQGYYQQQQYSDNYADNHGGPYNAYWYHNRPYRLSCGAAEERLEDYGFHNVTAKDCSGKRYHFSATKGGRRVQVVMNSRTGKFWKQ
jgi:hypothetical protein